MLDIKKIRADFDGVAAKLETRGVKKETLQELHELDVRRRELIVQSENLKKERNAVSDEIALIKREKGDASEKITAMKQVSADIKVIDAELADIEEKLTTYTTTLPNLPHDDVPVGADEDDNVEIRRHGQAPEFSFEPKPHWDLG
ncbi:MAG: serine--tRNA ligase, partial [Lactococcus garvieae]